MKKIIQTIAGVIGMLCIMAAGVYAEEINVGYEFSDMDYQEAVFDEQMYEGQWVDVDTHIQLFLPLEWTTEDIEEYKESNGELLFGASFGRNTTLSVLGEDHFRKEMPNVTTELDFDSEFHLLVAVMLSAQCTDKRVNMVTPELFRQYPTPQSLADATEDDVFALVKSVSYPNAKSRHLVEMARQLVERFDSVVPQTLDELVTLSGVGRKTANVMLSVAFGQGAMPVDTHVYRVSHRIGLVNDSDNTPLKVEQRLSRYIPKEELGLAHHWLLLHGRYVCTARKAHCYRCPIAHVCKSNEKR